MFVERHHLLWRPPEVQAWLKSSCSKIVEEIDRGEGGSTGAFGGGSASDLAAVCAETFPAFAEDEYAPFSDFVIALFDPGCGVSRKAFSIVWWQGQHGQFPRVRHCFCDSSDAFGAY